MSVIDILLKAEVAICTDSAWLHMAHLYDVATIGLFGFATADEWSPPGCTVVYSETVYPAKIRYRIADQYIQPLIGLDVEHVVRITREILEQNERMLEKP